MSIKAMFEVYPLADGFVEVHALVYTNGHFAPVPGTLTYDSEGVLRSYSEQLESDKDELDAMVRKQGIENMEELVEVKNLMSGKDVLIRKQEKGTALDPSQERYWAM